ncbi:hypothetical protein LWI29_038108 [Acer saccharum]|uniref:Uncharacterized protein n=1 Tax=Acer saccharum TaxID=4024 RepID=A0AA39T9R1_ACESA|nr:hypothetical protein LWI29_038108 [Acer saccharum]
MTLIIADNSLKTPVGVVEEVFVNVHGLIVSVEFVVLDVKGSGSYDRDWKLLFGRSFMATVGIIVDILSRNISFSCGGNVNFKVDRPKVSQVDDCLVLKTPKLRKKRSQVFTLIQAFEGVTNIEKGNHDCLKEQDAIELEEDNLATRTFEEIGKIRSRIHSQHQRTSPDVSPILPSTGTSALSWSNRPTTVPPLAPPRSPLRSMDFVMQNSWPSYPPMSMSSEDKIKELLQDAIASQGEIAQNFNNDMSPSWPNQSIETTFEGNLNNSYNQDWKTHQDFSMSYNETNGFEKPTSSCQPMFKSFEKEKKELIKMCKDVMNIDRVVMSKMEELKEGNARSYYMKRQKRVGLKTTEIVWFHFHREFDSSFRVLLVLRTHKLCLSAVDCLVSGYGFL